MNLVCGSNLPGTENLDIKKSLKRLDMMAAHVKRETERNYHRFQQAPQQHDNSLAKYKVGMLVTVLRQDFDLHYNFEFVDRLKDFDKMKPDDDWFYKNAHDVFISGMVTEHGKGTCASMPVLFVSIARRLGYPVYLVPSKGHLFCRWDDGKERFNFEGTGKGVQFLSDEHFMKFPRPISEDELDYSNLMQNMTPRQELATFLGTRAMALLYHGRNKEALVAAARAVELVPEDYATEHILAKRGLIPEPVVRKISHQYTEDQKFKHYNTELQRRLEEEDRRYHQQKFNTPLPR